MASLKRYRQTPDSNAAARFRDLPPRFKRQKSITEPNSSDNYVQRQSQKPKKVSQGDISISDRTKTIYNLNSDLIKESESTKDKKNSKKGTMNRPHLTVDQSFAKRTTQPIVLSPMDNNLFNFTRNDENECSSENTMNSFSWQNEKQPAWTHFTSDHASFPQVDTLPCNGTWSPKHQTKESPHKDFGQSSTLPVTTQYQASDTQSLKDYSETDKRIIEMFKELERVADQKEKEESENGTDRKSLVSHHLRMLMCAIDKYTEGIEDDVDSEGCVEEALTKEKIPSPSMSPDISKTSVPVPSQPYVQQPNTSINSVNGGLPLPSVYGQGLQATHVPVFKNSLQSHFPPVNGPFNAGNGKPPQISYKVSSPLSLSSADMQPWDLWSSPSINVLDVYNNLPKFHNSCETADSTFVLFDQLGMGNDYSPRADECLTRTPLYQR